MTIDVEMVACYACVETVGRQLDDYSPDRSRRLQVLVYAVADILTEDDSDDHLRWSAAKLSCIEDLLGLATLQMAMRRESET